MSKQLMSLMAFVMVVALGIGAVQLFALPTECECYDEAAAEALCEQHCQFYQGVGCLHTGFVIKSYCNYDCISTFEFWCEDYTYHRAMIGTYCEECQM